jgi:hypothetical protein
MNEERRKKNETKGVDSFLRSESKVLRSPNFFRDKCLSHLGGELANRRSGFAESRDSKTAGRFQGSDVYRLENSRSFG